MAEKEIWIYLLADILPCRISFKHTLQLWIAWRQSGAGSYDDDKLASLFSLLRSSGLVSVQDASNQEP